MDALQKQGSESFQSWATRIYEKMIFYEGWVSFPNSNTVAQYIKDIYEHIGSLQ